MLYYYYFLFAAIKAVLSRVQRTTSCVVLSHRIFTSQAAWKQHFTICFLPVAHSSRHRTIKLICMWPFFAKHSPGKRERERDQGEQTSIGAGCADHFEPIHNILTQIDAMRKERTRYSSASRDRLGRRCVVHVGKSLRTKRRIFSCLAAGNSD